jgi:hypothetical protein
MDRRKRVRIHVEGTRQIFEGILSRIEPLTALWNNTRWAFFSRICSLLQVSILQITETITNQFGFDPYDAESWELVGFSEDQVYMFSITEIWRQFHRSKIELAYQTISFNKWDREEGMSKLGYEYSLLTNLLFVRELGKLVGVECKSLETSIDILQPFFEINDIQGYQAELKKMRIPEPQGSES